MTQRRQLTIHPQSPVLCGDESVVGNYRETLDYIPGSVLRGAIAEWILTQDKTAFHRIFSESAQPPRFGNAYPTFSDVWGYPFPATARTCKQHSGYATANKPDGHGVFDILIPQALYELSSDPRFPHRSILLPEAGDDYLTLARSYEPYCPYRDEKAGTPKCAADVKPISGFYVLRPDGPGPAPRPRIARATHVGINRARGVAEDALLFTLETIEPTTEGEFRGEVLYDEAYAADFERLLNFEGAGQVLRIGRGRSRGMGKVEVTLAPVLDQPSQKALEERQVRLQEAFEKESQRYAEVPGFALASGYFFTLTLRSPAFFTDAAGLPSVWPDLTNTPLQAALRLRSWARTTLVGGWHSAARLPRRMRQAVEPGAVYLYFVPADHLTKAALLDALLRLELDGVGDQRERGFGQLTICAPFHYVGWHPGKIKKQAGHPVTPTLEDRLREKAQKAAADAKIWSEEELEADSQRENLVPAQVQLLWREAQGDYGVAHVMNWLRYQQTRVAAWVTSGLAKRILDDVAALQDDAQSDRAWLELVQSYLGYLYRWYYVAWKQQEGANE
jgi:CRISPR-associated protein Csx10